MSEGRQNPMLRLTTKVQTEKRIVPNCVDASKAPLALKTFPSL